MRTLAVLPVKRFGAAKQRLGTRLEPAARLALAEAMLEDVLAAITGAKAIEAAAVVTAEPRAEGLAAAAGAVVVRDEHEAGQSPAASAGVARALAYGCERVALLPGDTPLLTAAELDALLRRTSAARLGTAIVPDRHGTGTNALVLAPPDALTPSFGPGSLARHVAAARAAPAAWAVERVAGLEHDVDTAEDLDAVARLLESGPPQAARRTRAALVGPGAIAAVPTGARP
jgi:2-phospho-L-lactate guanylyltransferase